MRHACIWLLAFLFSGCLATKKPPGGTFEKFLSKSLSSSPVKLDDGSYDELTNGPRNYSAVVLLTALEARFGCQLCRDYQPEWDLIGKSWARGDRQGETRVVYGTLDFVDGKATFQKVRFLLEIFAVISCHEH